MKAPVSFFVFAVPSVNKGPAPLVPRRVCVQNLEKIYIFYNTFSRSPVFSCYNNIIMKLRSKLIITFLILILVPVLFTGTAFFGFGRHQISAVKELYGVEVESLLLDMILTMVMILVFTSVVLTAWIYKSIVTPIHHLQVATKKITEGNLDFEMPAGGDDEIGELCTDFEEMRRRLKESAEEKVESERQNKELISNISHDLKTPIAAVKGYVEGLMDGVADTPEKQEKYIRTIYNKANDMDRLINELSFYSKIDTNRIPYTFEKINVNAYFADCIEELSIEMEEQDIELTYSNYVEGDIQVIADAEQIKRVINNIVGNSVKYIDKPRGRIHIRVKDVGDFVQVEIEDNGKGIASKDLPQIFDRFYRADVSRNSSKGGSGIGLSIVKKIIEDHGGQVWATSKEQTGTVMYFVLRKYQEVPVT